MISKISTATLFLLLAFISLTNHMMAQSPSAISLRDRVITASKIYPQITTFYPDLSQKQFDKDYGEYLAQILSASGDRGAAAPARISSCPPRLRSGRNAGTFSFTNSTEFENGMRSKRGIGSRRIEI